MLQHFHQLRQNTHQCIFAKVGAEPLLHVIRCLYMKPSPLDEVFARHVVRIHVATPEQVITARHAQALSIERGTPVSLPDALVAQGIITSAQRDNLIDVINTGRAGALEQLGKYRIIKDLGGGGTGDVYLAEDIETQRKVALKILHRSFGRDPEFLSRFRREVRAAERLDHPNIARAYDSGEDMGHHYYAMEYCSGDSLHDVIDRERVLAPQRAVDIVARVASALGYAHASGIIHRDVKPDNINVSADGVVKLLDLGLSKDLGESRHSFNTQTGVAMGTPHYISPEQVRGDKVIDGRTDIYSLGATLYHLVTGQTPFDAPSAASIMLKHLNEELPNPKDIRPELSDELCIVIEKMMAKSPDHRYRDCNELLEDLAALQKGESLKTQRLMRGFSSVALPNELLARETPVQPVKRTRRRALVATLALLFCLAGAGAIGMYFLRQPEASSASATEQQPNLPPDPPPPPEPDPFPPPPPTDPDVKRNTDLVKWRLEINKPALSVFRSGHILAAGNSECVVIDRKGGLVHQSFPYLTFRTPIFSSTTSSQDLVIGGASDVQAIDASGNTIWIWKALGCCNVIPRSVDPIAQSGYTVQNGQFFSFDAVSGQCTAHHYGEFGDWGGLLAVGDLDEFYLSGSSGKFAALTSKGVRWSVEIKKWTVDLPEVERQNASRKDFQPLGPAALANDGSVLVCSVSDVAPPSSPGELLRVKNDGEVSWRREDAITLPVIDKNNVVYVATQNEKTCTIDALKISGETLWSKEVPGTPRDLAVGADGWIYAIVAYHESTILLAFNDADGKLKIHTTLTHFRNPKDLILLNKMAVISGSAIAAVPIEANGYQQNAAWPVKFHDNQRTNCRRTPLNVGAGQ